MTARRIREKSLRRREWERRLAQSHVDAKVDHILEAVRSGRVSIPAGLSRRRLRRDIQWAHTRYLTLPDLGSDARWRERYERLARIEKLARELKGLLSGETGRWVRDRISGNFPFRGEGTPRPAKQAHSWPSLA